MENVVNALMNAGKEVEEAAKLQFHFRSRPSFSIRQATPRDLKWMEEQRFAS